MLRSRFRSNGFTQSLLAERKIGCWDHVGSSVHTLGLSLSCDAATSAVAFSYIFRNRKRPAAGVAKKNILGIATTDCALRYCDASFAREVKTRAEEKQRLDGSGTTNL